MINVDFEFLFDSIAEGILFQDSEGRIIKVNRCASDLLELPVEDITKVSFPDSKFTLIHKDGTLLKAGELPFYNTLQSGKPTGEITFGLENKKTKQCRWVCARSFPCLSNCGSVKNLIVTILYDVTRYVNVEAESREKKDFFSAFFENKKSEHSCSEEAFHLKEIGFKKVQEIAKVGSWIYTSDNRLIWSEETYRIYNRSPENFVPTIESLIKVIHPEDQPLMKEWIRACMSGEKPGELIFRVFYLDGSVHYISGRGDLITGTEGKMSYMAGTAQDITERIQTENSLRRERWRLASIIEAIHVGTWEWDVQTNSVEINEKWAEIIGYSLTEVLPLDAGKWQQMMHPEDQNKATTFIERHISGELPYYVNEYRMKHKNGNWIWVEDRGKAMRNKEGKPIYMFGTHTDITERKKAEEDLVHSHKLMRYVIEHSWSGTAVFDREMRYIYVSQQFLHDYGAKEHDIIGKSHYEVFHVNQRWKDIHKRALAGEVLRNENDPYTSGNGAVYWTRWECRPWYESSGSIGGIIIYAENITDRKKAEESLRASERLLRKVIDTSTDFIYVKDRDLRTVICNERFASALGKKPSDMLGKTDIENGWPKCFVKGNSQKGIRGYEQDDLKALSGHTVHVTDELCNDSCGSKILDTIKLPLKDDTGKIIGLLGISRDITEQKRAEEKILQMHELFTKLTRLVPGMLCQYKLFPDGHRAFPYSSPGIKDVFELDPDDVREDSLPILDRIHKDDQARVKNTLLESASTLEVAKFEYRVVLPKKGQRYHLSQAYPERMEDGSTLWYSIILDITERKQNEEKLERQTERLRNLHYTDQQILSTKPLDIILKSSFEHLRYLINYTHANIALFDSELKKVDKIVSVEDSRIEFKDGQELSPWDFVNQELFCKGKIEAVENISKVKAITLTPFVNKNEIGAYINIPLQSEGTFIGALNIAWESPHFISTEEKDIISEIAGQITIAIEATRLRNESKVYARELERRVSERTVQLEAANRELEAFSYSVSHDLRAPLRAVDGFTRILVDNYSPLLDNEGKRICSVIQDSAKQMGRLIDDLLAFSRAGRTKLTLSDVNSELIVKSVFFDITTEKEKSRIDFRIEPLPIVIGDPNLIKQVWTNLISNAVKFTSKKERAEIAVSADLQGEMVVFSIKDNGAGFDMQYAGKIFGVFERLHSSREFPGTGVGLAIVQRIVQRHGGRIWAYGEVGKGATFSFTLKKKD